MYTDIAPKSTAVSGHAGRPGGTRSGPLTFRGGSTRATIAATIEMSVNTSSTIAGAIAEFAESARQ